MMRMRVLLLLAVVALGVVVIGLVVADRRHSAPTIHVSPRQLAAAPETFEGERVATSGVVRVFEADTPNEYYVVEEAGDYRVGLRGVPNATLRPLVGLAVDVAGTFDFSPTVGVYLQVTTIARAAR